MYAHARTHECMPMHAHASAAPQWHTHTNAPVYPRAHTCTYTATRSDAQTGRGQRIDLERDGRRRRGGRQKITDRQMEEKIDKKVTVFRTVFF